MEVDMSYDSLSTASQRLRDAAEYLAQTVVEADQPNASTIDGYVKQANDLRIVLDAIKALEEYLEGHTNH